MKNELLQIEQQMMLLSLVSERAFLQIFAFSGLKELININI